MIPFKKKKKFVRLRLRLRVRRGVLVIVLDTEPTTLFFKFFLFFSGSLYSLTNAGLYSSAPAKAVSDRDAVQKAIQEVWASMWTEK